MLAMQIAHNAPMSCILAFPAAELWERHCPCTAARWTGCWPRCWSRCAFRRGGAPARRKCLPSSYRPMIACAWQLSSRCPNPVRVGPITGLLGARFRPRPQPVSAGCGCQAAIHPCLPCLTSGLYTRGVNRDDRTEAAELQASAALRVPRHSYEHVTLLKSSSMCARRLRCVSALFAHMIQPACAFCWYHRRLPRPQLQLAPSHGCQGGDWMWNSACFRE